MGLSFGPTAANTRASSRTIISRVLATTCGWMVANTRAPGATTRCTAGASSSGPMAESTKASMSMTRSKATGSSVGLMVGATGVSGRMASRMVRAPTGTRKEWRGMGLGSTGRNSSGMTDIMNFGLLIY